MKLKGKLFPASTKQRKQAIHGSLRERVPKNLLIKKGEGKVLLSSETRSWKHHESGGGETTDEKSPKKNSIVSKRKSFLRDHLKLTRQAIAHKA